MDRDSHAHGDRDMDANRHGYLDSHLHFDPDGQPHVDGNTDVYQHAR